MSSDLRSTELAQLSQSGGWPASHHAALHKRGGASLQYRKLEPGVLGGQAAGAQQQRGRSHPPRLPEPCSEDLMTYGYGLGIPLVCSWLQSPSAVILEPQKIKSDTVSTVSPSI